MWGHFGCVLRHCTSEPFDSQRLSKLAERTEHTHSTLHGRCADVPRADHDRAGSRVALRIEILCMPFFHLFDFSTSQNVGTAFVFQQKKTIDVTDLSCIGQKQFVTSFKSGPP